MEREAPRQESDRQLSGIGTMVSELYSPNMARIMKAAGFDYILIDAEHGFFTLSEIAAMVSVARAVELPAFLRTDGDGQSAGRYLDMGASGIVLPMSRDAGACQSILASARYPPEGDRGISLTRAHSNYSVADVAGYLVESNRRVQCMVQIETPQALNAVEEFAALPEVDGLVLGPGDLAVTTGSANGIGREDLLGIVHRIAAVAMRHGVVAGIISSDQALLKECQHAGMTFICYASEIRLILSAARLSLKALSDFQLE